MTLLIIITPFVIKGSSQRRCQAESGSESGAKDNTGELSNLSLVSLKHSVLINLMDLATPSIYSADSDLFDAQSADIRVQIFNRTQSDLEVPRISRTR